MAKTSKTHFLKKPNFENAAKIYYLCAAFALVALSLFNLAAYADLNKTSYVLGINTSYEDKIKYWESFLEIYPDYKDGWIKLAQLYYKNGDALNAKAALNMALDIDPNSEEIKSIKVSLGL